MFPSGSPSICQLDNTTLQHYLINSTCKRAPFESQPTAENDIISIADSNLSQDSQTCKSDGFCNHALTNLNSPQGMWEGDGYQTGSFPSMRKHCGHTTCGDTCLLQTCKGCEAEEPTRDYGLLQDGGQPASYLTQGRQDYLWDEQMMSSPSKEQVATCRRQDPINEQKGDLLTDIDYNLRQSVDLEIEAFRVNLHNLLSDQHHQYGQLLTPENDQVKEQMTVCDNPVSRDSNYVWSPMNATEHRLLEESPSSSYSMQDEESSQHFHGDIIRHEDDINSVMVQLLTSASQLSHSLKRQEYAT